MSAYKSEFLNVLATRGFIHQLSDAAGLDARAAGGNKLLEKFVRALPVTDLRYIRPAETLPVTVAGFQDEEGIGKAYRIGWLDVQRGFTAYDWSTFEL